VTLSVLVAQPAKAAASPIPAGSTEIINRQSVNCLTVDNSLAQGSYAYTAGCTTRNGGAWSRGQVWVIVPQVHDSLGTFTIRPWADQTKCLDVQWGSAGNDVPIWLWPCNGTFPDGGAAQRFSFRTPTGVDPMTSNWKLIGTSFGRCFDKNWWGNVVQYDCWSPWWQQWLTNAVQV
jgi:hypothetical protein